MPDARLSVPALTRASSQQVSGRSLRSAFETRLVANHPQQTEVRVGFAFKDAFEVELDVGLAREARVVAEDEELQTV